MNKKPELFGSNFCAKKKFFPSLSRKKTDLKWCVSLPASQLYFKSIKLHDG